MKMRRGSCVSLLAAGILLTATSCGGGSTSVLSAGGTAGATGVAGSGDTSGAGGDSPTTGAGGDTTTGTGGSTTTGAGGSTTTGAGGDTTTGAGGDTTTGTGGSTTTGTGGAAGAGTAGATGTGTAGTGGGGHGPTGMSAGCGMAPADATGKFNHHTIMVTGVDPTVKPATGGASWTMRDYYLDLPAGYDGSKPFPIIFGGGGCGGALVTNGQGGGFAVLPANNTQAIQVGLSYVWPQGGGACFADDGANTPDLPYFDSVLAQIEANYCVDKAKVFMGGYSSGGW